MSRRSANTAAAPAGWKSFLVRTALPTALAMLLFIAALFQILIPAIEKNSMAHKREMIRELTNAAWNILARLHAEEQRGRLSQQQAQQMAVAQISTLRYGRQMQDYFWIHDTHPRMILHPYRTDLNGQDLTDFTTPDGRRIFVEMRDIVRQSGSGFVQYPWQGQGDGSEVVPKVSYIRGFEPWGWILGTGINLNDVRTEIARLMRHVIAISVVILCVVALLLGFLSLQNLKLERQRTAALQALQASADQYRTIFETTGTAMVIIEDDLRLSLVNSEFEKLSGYAASEVEGRKLLTDFVIPEDRQRLQTYHYARRADPAAAPRNYEFGLCTRQGTVRNIYMTVALVPHTRASVGSFLDMTDHKKALQVLAESEERFRSLVENALTGIFIIQEDQIIYSNPEQKRLFGPISSGFKITNVDKVHPEDQAAVRRFYEDVLSGKARTADIDYRFYSMGRQPEDTALKWAHCRVSPIEYMGKPSVLVNMTDVTRAKELEYLLSVKDKMISLGHVAAGIAHEIRNPLSGINIFMDAIRENFEDPASAEDIKGLITQAQAAAGKIESVVKAVLDFARPGTPRFEPADINVAVGEAVKLSQAALRKADIRLETELQQGLPLVSIDINQIEQVMLNLITNASDTLKSIDGRRLILISSAGRQDGVVIRVADSGTGIPPENRRKIFDPFYTTKKEGSGIGLCICQRIITDHKGTITVDQSRWGGADFVIRIPINNRTPEASNA